MSKLDWVVLLLAVLTIIGLAILYVIINPDILNAYFAPGQDLGRHALT